MFHIFRFVNWISFKRVNNQPDYYKYDDTGKTNMILYRGPPNTEDESRLNLKELFNASVDNINTPMSVRLSKVVQAYCFSIVLFGPRVIMVKKEKEREKRKRREERYKEKREKKREEKREKKNNNR